MPVVRKHAAELRDSKEVVGRSVLLSNNKLIPLARARYPPASSVRVRVLTLVGLTPRPRQRRAHTLRKFGRNQAYGALRKARGKGGSRSTDSGPNAGLGGRTVPCRELTHLCDQEQVGGGVRAARAVPRLAALSSDGAPRARAQP